MTDTSGMYEIRGLDVDKLAKGFSDEETIMKKFVTVSPTKNREGRWYQKTAGFLKGVATTGIPNTNNVSALGTSVPERARPSVIEPSFTRNLWHIDKFFFESPTISIEDIQDSDPDVIGTIIRDTVKAVEYQIDLAIYFGISDNANIQTVAATADGWDDSATGNPILDLLVAKQMIRAYGYNPEGAIACMNSIEHKNLINFLISVKGSSIPNFSSEKVRDGVVMEVVGLQVAVTEAALTDECLVFVPQRTATWKEFMPMSTALVTDEGIGKKFRCWSEGDLIVTDPKAAVIITDTVV